MRLIRLGHQPTGVTADIRAALTAIGRGGTVVGGAAVLGGPIPEGQPAQPGIAPAIDRAIDAVIFTPRAVLVVGAVTLPEPALHLEAPLNGQWRADGWRVESGGAGPNPAGEALERCGRFAARIRELHPMGEEAPVGTVIAVGPYVGHVEQPATELTGSIRVLHPTATSMLSATVSMPRQQDPLTTGEVRAFLAALAPDATHPGDEALLAEGFAPSAASSPEPTPADSYLGTVESTVPAPAPTPVANTAPVESTAVGTAQQQFGNPAPPPASPAPPSTVTPTSATGTDQAAPAAVTTSPTPPERNQAGYGQRRHTKRWLPAVALTVLGFLLIGVAVTAMVGGGGSAAPSHTGETDPSRPPATQVAGVSFVPRATEATSSCAQAAFGDLAAELETSDCRKLHRASFTARVDGKPTATTVAVLSFPKRETAETLRKLAKRPGTGGIHDVASERDQWPGPAPRFAGAAYVTDTHKSTLRLVRTGWIEEPSRRDDPALKRVAEAALQLPLP